MGEGYTEQISQIGVEEGETPPVNFNLQATALFTNSDLTVHSKVYHI
jgi:hypothetical protein